VTWHSGMVTSAEEEESSERENGGDDTSWVDVNLTGPKNKENLYGQFGCYKWTVKI
jgi:hypothetical protein